MKVSFTVIAFVIAMLPLHGQKIFELGQKSKVDIDFQASNHFIIVNVLFNNVLPLKFIFDTGSEHTLLFKKEYADLLGLQYERKIPLMGADLSQEIFGYISRGIPLRLAEDYIVNTDILVLEEDYLKLEESTGIQIDGIIGSNVFRYFVITINNRRNKIEVEEVKSFKPKKRYQQLPVEIFKNKPYIEAQGKFSRDTLSVKLLLDTGAGLPLLLYTNTDSDFKRPESTITGKLGMGLGGHLEGYIGRLDYFIFGQYEFENILTSFQEVSVEKEDLQFERNGILGNSVLGRFNYSINYPEQKLYFRANRRLKRKFKYDKSGLIIAATGHELRDFVVQKVQFNSPANHADIRRGDLIKKIEGIPTSFFNLTGINSILSKREGRKVTLHIARGNKILKKKIRLQQLI